MPALLLVLAVVLLFLATGLRWVPEGTVCTVHRFGRFVRMLEPGLRWTFPFLDQIAHKVPMIGHQVRLPVQPLDEGRQAQAAVFFQILEPSRTGVALDSVDALVESQAAACLAALAQRVAANDALAGELKAELNRHLSGLGLLVTRCHLQLTAA